MKRAREKTAKEVFLYDIFEPGKCYTNVSRTTRRFLVMSEEWTRRPPKRARQEGNGGGGGGGGSDAGGGNDDGDESHTDGPDEAPTARWPRNDASLVYSEYPPSGMPPPHPADYGGAGGPVPVPYQPWQMPYPPPPMLYPPFHAPYGYQPPPPIPPPYYPDPSMVPPHYAEVPPAGGHSASTYSESELPGSQVAAMPPGGKDLTEEEEEDGMEDDHKPSADDGEIGSYSAASRMKMYVKSKVPTRQEILDRRARKNAQSRARAAKLRERIIEIRDKASTTRTEEESALLEQFETRRQRKNNRSRERAIEKKTEIDRILNKPERKRSKLERQFLETALTAKQRKNEGDRLRRQRLKVLGKNRLGQEDGQPNSEGGTAGYGMPEIPVSPLPPHQPMPSPGFPNINFPSPPNPRRSGAAPAPGVSETPGRTGGAAQLPLSFIPPNQQFVGTNSPARSQLHLPQHSSQVEQRRHPDGSMTISIGGRGGPPFGGEVPPSPDESNGAVNMSDMSHLLLYGDNGEDQEPGAGTTGATTRRGGQEDDDDEEDV